VYSPLNFHPFKYLLFSQMVMTGHFFGHEFFKSYSILFSVFSKNVDFIGLLRGHFMLFYWLSYAGHDGCSPTCASQIYRRSCPHRKSNGTCTGSASRNRSEKKQTATDKESCRRSLPTTRTFV